MTTAKLADVAPSKEEVDAIVAFHVEAAKPGGEGFSRAPMTSRVVVALAADIDRLADLNARLVALLEWYATPLCFDDGDGTCLDCQTRALLAEIKGGA